MAAVRSEAGVPSGRKLRGSASMFALRSGSSFRAVQPASEWSIGSSWPMTRGQRPGAGRDTEEPALLHDQSDEGGLTLQQVGGGLCDFGQDLLEAPAGQEAGGQAAEPLEFPVAGRGGGEGVPEGTGLALGEHAPPMEPGPSQHGSGDRQDEPDDARLPHEVDGRPATEDRHDGQHARREQAVPRA